MSSGKGVHAYYFLKEPVQLYHNLEDTLAELKEGVTGEYRGYTEGYKAS